MPWPSLGEVVVIEKDSAGNLMHGHSPLMRNSVLRISCKDSATAISAGASQEGRAHVPVDSEAANSRRKATRARTQSANEKVSAANLMQGQRHGYLRRPICRPV